MENIENTGNAKCELDILKAIESMSKAKQEEFINWIIEKLNEKEVTITPLKLVGQDIVKAIDGILVSDTLL